MRFYDSCCTDKDIGQAYTSYAAYYKGGKAFRNYLQKYDKSEENMKQSVWRKKKELAFLCLGAALAFGGCTAADTVREQTGTAGYENDTEVLSDESISDGTESGTEETYAAEEAEPVVRTVTITAVGDCTLGATQTHGYEGSFHEYYDNYGEEYFFAGVREVFESDDLTLVNLECVLTTSEDRVEKEWNLKGRPEYTGILTSSSVEACSLGNNHTQDYGEISLIDTENALEEAGVVYGYNDHVGLYTTEDGVTIGIVSANLLSQSQEYEDYIQNGIAQLREQGAELIVACCHWGIEREYYPTEYQQETAHKIIDWGADLVIGNHPHVLQGIEMYDGKVICYSLGNFCFGGNRNPSDKETMIYQQTFTFVDGVLQPDVTAQIIPCRLSSITSRNDFQPTILTGEEKQEVIEHVNAYSAPYGDVYADEEGRLSF